MTDRPKAKELPTLEGPRVDLRWLQGHDVDALYELFADPQVARYWSWPRYQRRSQAEALLQQIRDCFAADSLYQWGVARRSDGQIIGTTTLAAIDRNNRRAEVGFALRSDHWGQGWMSEAVTLLLDHAFGALNLNRLEADIDPLNQASIRLVQRMGFREEGLLRERWIVDGKVADTVLFGLLAREWRARE